MSYESGNSVSIDEIPGVEYDPEAADEINNDNVQPFEDTVDDLRVTTHESEKDDLRRDIIFNI